MGMIFFVDMGSDISILPAKQNVSKKTEELVLFAANNTRILTYEQSRLSLSLGLRRDFGWNFCVAAVPYPIIGADLLAHYGLLVDERNRELIDPMTNSCVMRFVKSAPIHTLSTIDRTLEYSKVLTEFPEVTNLSQVSSRLPDGTVHHILTRGPPVLERARRLN
ncbi:uncharacterized protein LOC117182900 [Belonocnema kinseyi]|uniref:uncharacterized protein LOC117182900 n=1 Tax=Belonocnema kinseyi TaxID=2817044 RepID=UPI00143DB5BC|nr:uncharacterized protein LOC117182900 [Belonocnema kinseyi]